MFTFLNFNRIWNCLVVLIMVGHSLQGCVRYLNRCTTCLTYITYQLNEKHELAITYNTFFYFKHCHFWKRRLPAIRLLSTNHDVFMKFTTRKSKQASFQIVWRITVPKRIPLQISKQLFGWNGRPDKTMRPTGSFMLNTKVFKFKKEYWLQIHD